MQALRPLLALAAALTSSLALAHPGHAVASFASGVSHPLGGLDHLLALLAVGLYAARQAGAARWALPLGFLVTMLAGAQLSLAGLVLPQVETGIASSVLVLGLLVASGLRLPLAAALPLLGAFALCHGAAHYAERGAASLGGYTIGFILASAAVHGLGYLMACASPRSALGRRLQRAGGSLIAACGVVMLGA